MAVRDDVTIDFSLSPRIITLSKDGASPTAITIQDLHDTLRTIEGYVWNVTHPSLVNSYGKQNLGGSTFVGITMVLQNTRLSFEAREGPPFTLCTVGGGNLVAVDTSGNPIEPICPTDYVTVQLAQSTSGVRIADVAEWAQAEKDTIKAQTQSIESKIGTPASATISADIEVIKSKVDTSKTDVLVGIGDTRLDVAAVSGGVEGVKQDLETTRQDVRDHVDTHFYTIKENPTGNPYDSHTDSLEALRDFLNSIKDGVDEVLVTRKSTRGFSL